MTRELGMRRQHETETVKLTTRTRDKSQRRECESELAQVQKGTVRVGPRPDRTVVRKAAIEERHSRPRAELIKGVNWTRKATSQSN